MKKIFMVNLLFAFSLFQNLLIANPDNPPNKKTGAPLETTCADCHENLNVGGGLVSVVCTEQYTPGDTVSIFVQVSKAGQERWGFEMTALDLSNEPAGKFVVIDSKRTQLSTEGSTGREYVKQTSQGTYAGIPHISPGWLFFWISPKAGAGEVVFFAAGIAADNDGKTSGDYIYTTQKVIQQSQHVSNDQSWGGVKQLYK